MNIDKALMITQRIMHENDFTQKLTKSKEYGDIIGYGFTADDFGQEYPEIFLLDCTMEKPQAKLILYKFVQKRFTEVCYIMSFNQEKMTEFQENLAWETVYLSLTIWRNQWNKEKLTKQKID